MPLTSLRYSAQLAADEETIAMTTQADLPRFRRLAILNLIEDARDFLGLEHPADSDTLVVSTHGAVDDFLQGSGLRVLPMASLNSYDFIRDTFSAGEEVVSHILGEFDRRWARALTHSLGLPEMKLFSPLYSYIAKYEYLNLRRMIAALDSLLGGSPNGEILIYRPQYEEGFFDGETNLTKIAQLIGHEHGFTVTIRRSISAGADGFLARGLEAFKRAYASPAELFPAARDYLADMKSARLEPHFPTILLFGAMYDLSFLRRDTLSANIVRILPGPGLPTPWRLQPKEKNRLTGILAEQSRNITAPAVSADRPRPVSLAETLLEQSLARDIRDRVGEYLIPVVELAQADSEMHFRAAITGQGPASGAAALIAEYFMKQNVPVVAMQHGATFGVQRYYSCHFDSDYGRCSHYLSYGFDSADLEELHPGRPVPCRIVPVGAVKLVERGSQERERRETIDLVYPFANSWSIMIDVIRNRSDVMTANQLRILDILESFTEISVVVKAFPNMVQRTCSIMGRLRRLKHPVLHKDYSLNAWLKMYKPRGVVLDFPSTPLFEVMDQDCEIFLLEDPLIPFGATARSLLEKRVHLFPDVDSLETGLLSWNSGTLPRLRDNTFYSRYVSRPDSRSQVRRYLENLLNEAPCEF